MNFVYDDGGRLMAGYKGDTGDCVTRAIAIATGLPYRQVYDDLFERARNSRKYMAQLELRYGKNARNHLTPRSGMPRHIYEPYLVELNWVWVPLMGIGTGCQVHLREGELPPVSALVIRLSRHLTSVVQGEIHDLYDPSRDGTRCVYGVFMSALENQLWNEGLGPDGLPLP